MLRPIPGRKGSAKGVYLTGEESNGVNNISTKSATSGAPSSKPIYADGSTPHGANTAYRIPAEKLGKNGVPFAPPDGHSTAQIDTQHSKQNGGSSYGVYLRRREHAPADNVPSSPAKNRGYTMPAKHLQADMVGVRNRQHVRSEDEADDINPPF